MKTAELTGALLDYWVAKAEGMEAKIVRISHDAVAWSECMAKGRLGYYQYTPSATWRHGGPVIERGRYTLASPHDDAPADRMWQAWTRDGIGHWGATPLVAAMRAYVASKFGDEVPEADTLKGETDAV